MTVETRNPSPLEQRCELAAWILMAALLLYVLSFKMVAALVIGLFTHTVLHRFAGHLHENRRFSHGAAKVVSAIVVAVVAAGAAVGVVFLFVALLRGRIGDLPTLLQRVADTIDTARVRLQVWGLSDLLPQRFTDAGELQTFLSGWFREHSEHLRKGAGAAGKFVLHALIGIVVAILVFFRRRTDGEAPLVVALSRRVLYLADSFERVLLAQAEIAAINTVITAFYLYVVLGFLGGHLPMTPTLIVITFVAGLIPVAGNIISNTVIVLLSLGVSPWIALLSLVFLVVVHKLEYLLNAKIVGVRIHAAAWETLLALFVMEAAFGARGVVIAPVLYAYLKRELSEKGLV